MGQVKKHSRGNERRFAERLLRAAFRWAAQACLGVGLAMLVWGCQSEEQVLAYHDSPSGERLYRARCASCHMLIEPARHSDPEWVVHVEEYGRNMSVAEKQLVVAYLQQVN